MTHFNLNRMLQGCSAFIQTMAGDRAARNDAKRVNNHVLPLTCPLLASSLRLTCPLQLHRIALILCVLVLSVGQAWAVDPPAANFTVTPTLVSGATYEATGLSITGSNKGLWVEVPSASAEGFISIYGDNNADRYYYIYGSNGTVKDTGRGIKMVKTVYAPPVYFSPSDIYTTGGKYYLVFYTTDDFKASKVQYTLCSKTKVTTSSFYPLYANTSKSAAQLKSAAGFPANIVLNIDAVGNSKSHSSTVETPHDFKSNINTATTYYYITPNAVTQNIFLGMLANVKSIRLYGDGNGGGRTFYVTVTKVSGDGSLMTVSNIVTTNSATIKEWSTGDLTSLTGYDADTYYTYTITYSGNASRLWGIYVEAGAASGKTYTFDYGTGNPWAEHFSSNFVQDGSSETYYVSDFTIPADLGGWSYYVGESGNFKSSGLGKTGQTSSETVQFKYLSVTNLQASSCTGGDYFRCAASGAHGRLRIYADASASDKNLYVGFEPSGYILRMQQNDDSWVTKQFTDRNDTRHTYESEMVTLPTTSKQVYVALQTQADYSSSDNGVAINNWTNGQAYTHFKKSNGTYGEGGDGYNSYGTIAAGDAGKSGKFRFWYNYCDDNGYLHFVPYHKLTYNANGGSGAPEADYVSVETTPCQWSLSTTQPTREDYVFLGWSTNSSAAAADADAEVADLGSPYTASGDVTLYAVWQACSGPTISANGRTGIVDGAHEVGDELGTASVTATAGNGGALSYKWYYYDDSPGKPVDPNDYTAAPGTNNQATYQIPSSSTCTARHYFCVVSEEGCSTTVEGIPTGALTLTEPADPCTEPEELTNEIARFFVPCGTSTSAAFPTTEQDASTGDNTFTVNQINSDGWATNATTGFIYGKLSANDKYIIIALKSGKFRAGDVVYGYFNSNDNGNNLKLHSSSGNALGAASSSGYNSEYVRTYTLTAADIESDGSIKFFRSGAELRVNRIIVTRPNSPCFTFTAATSSQDETAAATHKTISTSSGGYAATLTGGAMDFYGATSKVGCNKTNGLVFDADDDILTVTLSSGILPAGAIIHIEARGNNSDASHTCGFVVSNNAMTPATNTSSTSANPFAQSYVVTASDGIEGTNTFTIKRAAGKAKTYLKALYIIGCEEEETYTVTYKPGDGGTGDDVVVSPATTIGGKPVGFTAPTGKTFVRWNTAANGSGTNYYEGDPVTSDLTLHAQWGYVLTYDANAGGDAVSNLPDPEPHMPEVTTLSSTVPTRSGYTFSCWNRNAAGTGDCFSAGGSFTMGAENQTLYAKWTEDECTPTTLFSMVVSNSASNYNLAAGTTINQSDEAISSRLTSISGGGISITNNSGSSNKTVFASTALSLLNADVQCAIALTGATLQAGDVITVTTTSSGKPYLTSTAAKSNEVTWSTSSYTHSITLANTSNATGKNLIGKSTFYLWYGGSSVYIRSISVTRPCDESAETCKTPNITNIASTTNMMTAETKSLNVTVSNTTALTGTVSYAWTNSDGSAIAVAANASGANTARLTLTKPTAGTYTFICTVTNNCGGDGSQSASSAIFTVNVTESDGCTEIAKVIVSGKDSGTGSGTKIADPGGYGVNLENTTSAHGGNTGYKIGSGNYVYLQLASGEQFQNGDKVKVYITNLSDQGDNKLHIFQGTTAAGTEVATVNSPALGWNETTLSGVTSGQRSLTIHRSSGTTEQNHGIYAFAVERCVDCTPATHEGLAYTKTSYTVDETAEALTVTNPENADSYQWKWNTTNDRTSGTNCGTNAASFTPPTTAEVTGTRYYWCELTNDCGTVKTSAVGITVSADLSDVTVTWTDPTGTVNYGGGGYTIKATVGPAAWDGTLDVSMLAAPDGIRIYDVEINNTEHTLQAKFDVQTTFDREANATDIPFALTLGATATYESKISEHNVTYDACAAGGGGGILFSQNFNSATEVAYTNGEETEITTSSGNNIVGNTAASQFTYIGIVNKSSTGIAINTESGGNSQDITGAFQAYANNTSGKYALVKTTNFAASAPTALRIEADVWFHTLSSSSNYSLSFAVGEGFSNGTGGASASNVHSGFSFYNASAVYLYAYKDKSTKISGTNQFTQSEFQKVTWVINNTGADLEYTNPAGTKSTLGDDKFDVWVETKQFVSGQAASTGTKALQNLYIGDPNGKNHEFRLDNVTVTDISTSSGTGTITTALTWSNSQADNATLPKDEGTADFAVTAVRDAAATTSLGAVTYSSSDASVATVNETTGQVHIADNIDFGGATYKETTITATLAASGCYKRAEITYVLRVNARPCDDVAGTVTSNTVGCTTTLTLSGYTTDATIQWYKDGVAIPSATSATYAATASGEYYAVTSKNCDRTSNTVTVTSTAVSATKLVDEWYVKNGRRTPDIALVQTTNATDFTVTTGSPASDIKSTGIGGCGFYLGTDGIIYLKGAQNDGSDPSDMTEGDTEISITASGCTDAAPVTITIHRQVETDKYVLAYVVTGKQDGGWTQDPPSDQTTGVELYRTLTNHFDLQATNIYATTDEQKIKEYYSRYDIIFITDYPNTKTKNETTKKSYVDALGAMIDIRPILTMEAWVSGLTNWSEKGVKGSPKSPTTRQYNMLLQCKDHEIFSGTTVETIGEGDDVKFKINMVDSTKALYDTLDTKYGAGEHAEKTGYCYGKHPALQGFVYDETLADMLPLGLIDDGEGNNLQVGLERQKEMEARMMVLGINADAMERLSDDGETVIVNALKYLMKKDAEDISDCSIYFDNAGGDHLWSNVANWGPSHLTLPQPTQEARILQPCIVDGAVAKAASVKIVTGGMYNHGSSTADGSLTIRPTGKLSVGGRIVAASAPNYYEVRPTDAAKLVIEANNLHTGALIHGHKSGELNATVQLVSKAYSERVTEGGKTKTKKYWQYVGLPVQEALAEDAFYGGYTYKYEESAGWEKKRTGDMLEEFWGIGLSYDNYVLGKTSPITFTISGALALATNRDIELTKTAEAGNGENMIGNSWTAPIHLVNMTAEDFENATATIYLFNTGRNDSHTNSDNGSTTPGQWVSVPVAAIKLDPWVGPKVIPAMQAFEVDVAGGATSGTLHLNYDKHVRAIATIDEENEPLRAPKRYMSEEPSMMRLRVADTATYTDLYLIEGEQLSDEFDNGWDGKYQQCDGRSATLYALSPIGNMAVLAQQSINNTAIVFRPGRQNEYTFTFGYNGEVAYYLNDLLLEQSTEIREGNEYRFTCNEGDMESRFVVSTTPFGAPDITTGIGNAGHPEKVQKIMYKDHIYIIRAGRVYDIVGKEVR